jgi:hypothetical protein
MVFYLIVKAHMHQIREQSGADVASCQHLLLEERNSRPWRHLWHPFVVRGKDIGQVKAHRNVHRGQYQQRLAQRENEDRYDKPTANTDGPQKRFAQHPCIKPLGPEVLQAGTTTGEYDENARWVEEPSLILRYAPVPAPLLQKAIGCECVEWNVDVGIATVLVGVGMVLVVLPTPGPEPNPQEYATDFANDIVPLAGGEYRAVTRVVRNATNLRREEGKRHCPSEEQRGGR